jgi:hypothetical protein
MKKRCHGCAHWQKWPNHRTYGKSVGNQSLGLCNLKDARCNGDHHCEHWQAVPYDRTEQKEIIIRSIKAEMEE